MNPDSGFQVSHSFAWIPESESQTLASWFTVPGFGVLAWAGLLFQTPAFGLLVLGDLKLLDLATWFEIRGLGIRDEIPFLGLLALKKRTLILCLNS